VCLWVGVVLKPWGGLKKLSCGVNKIKELVNPIKCVCWFLYRTTICSIIPGNHFKLLDFFWLPAGSKHVDVANLRLIFGFALIS